MRRRLAVAACGSEDAAEPGAEGDAVQTVELTASEFAFAPAEITLEAAGTYRFVLTNDGDAPHALEIEGNGVEAETDVIEGGAEGELEVALDEGEYEMYCPVGDHADMGMVGTIVVGTGAGGATTDDETTTEDEAETETETETETDDDSAGNGAGY